MHFLMPNLACRGASAMRPMAVVQLGLAISLAPCIVVCNRVGDQALAITKVALLDGW